MQGAAASTGVAAAAKDASDADLKAAIGGLSAEQKAKLKAALDPTPPITLTVENKWNEGKTKEEVAAVLKEFSEACMKVDGVYSFQYAMDEENKCNFLTEVYKDAAGIGGMMAASKELQPKLFGVITTTRVVCSGPEAGIAPVKEALAGFGTEFFYTDPIGNAWRVPPKGSGEGAPLVLTVENKFNDGKTKADIAPILKKMGEACVAVRSARRALG